MPEMEYDAETTLPLAVGDMLVLLTDGFYEWQRADGDQLGMERICDLLRQHHALPPAELIQTIRGAVEEFAAGTPQTDDLTAVILKRVPA
jgi:phosphoserine phosphatase